MDTCSCEYLWYKRNTNIPWRNEQGEKIMANRVYNKQVSPKGYKRGGGVTGVKAKQSKEHKKKTPIRTFLKNTMEGKYMDLRRGTAEPRIDKRVKKMGGGSLKAVPAGNKGLKKLPTKVRNKMGFMKKGGKVNG